MRIGILKGEGLNQEGIEKGETVVTTDITDLQAGAIPGIGQVQGEILGHLIDLTLETADILLEKGGVIPETVPEIEIAPVAETGIIQNPETVPEITTKRVVQNTTNPVEKGVPHPSDSRKTKRVQ